MNQLTEGLLFLGTMLSITGFAMIGFTYLVFRRETSSDRIVKKLDAALSAQAIADEARPWYRPTAYCKPVNVGAYEVRPAWYDGEAFLAWWNGEVWTDFMSREELLAQDWEWRKLVKINTLA